MKPKTTEALIAATDVGANAVRLEIARGFSDGSIESVHQERDPVRPSEGRFQTGIVPIALADPTLRGHVRTQSRNLPRSPDGDVRRVAAEGLAELGNPSALQPLERALSAETVAKTRRALAQAIAELRPSGETPGVE